MHTHQNIETVSFLEAATIIDESGVVEMVERWAADDRTALHNSALDVRTMLAGWLATAFAGSSLSEANVAMTLRDGYITDDAAGSDVASLTRQLLDLMDYRPLPASDRPRTKARYDGVLRERAADAQRLAEKRRRHLAFMNAILRAQLDLTGCVYDKLSIALGSVTRAAGVEGIHSNDYQQMHVSEHVSAEPDAGFALHNREERTFEYGWTYEVTTLVSNDLLGPDSVPDIVIGIAGHQPHSHGPAAREVVTELLGSGRSIERVMGEVAYFPMLNAELVQQPLREHGADLVMEYTALHEGTVLAVADDAVLVEGQWFRSNMPDVLRTAMKDFREASQDNRTGDGSRVIDAGAQRRLAERRDALLDARRDFETPAPPSTANQFEQYYAYGSPAWTMAFTQGRYAHTKFGRAFRDTDSDLTPRTSSLSGEAAHGFITTLIIAATNAQHIAEWELYHSLDEGNGLMVDEWYAMYHLLVPRIQAGMAEWSRKTQAHARAYWNTDGIEDTHNWRPDGAATVIEMARATEELADTVATSLISSLRQQADFFCR